MLNANMKNVISNESILLNCIEDLVLLFIAARSLKNIINKLVLRWLNNVCLFGLFSLSSIIIYFRLFVQSVGVRKNRKIASAGSDQESADNF